MDLAHVSRAQSRMAGHGSIAAERDPADTRRVIVTITGAGLDPVRAISQQAQVAWERLLAAMTAQGYAVFLRVLGTLFAATDTAG